MSTFANTYQTYTAKGQREDLADVIYDVTPTDTPFLNNIGRGEMEAVTHEWQTDALDAPDGSNAVPEGDDITSIPAAVPTARVGNRAQISRKLISVSGTLERVRKAGRRSEKAYQLTKQSAALKRDMETILLSNQTPVAGANNTARKMAAMGSWVKTNVNYNTGDGANPAWTEGVPTTGRTDGTVRPITEVMFKDVLQKCWAAGAVPRIASFNAINKQNASKVFAGVATKTYFQSAREAMAVIAAVDLYVGDFGEVAFVANRFQRERDCWVLDPEYLSVRYLRPFFTEPLAKTGDADKSMLLVEYTLRVDNELSQGLVADLDSVLQ